MSSHPLTFTLATILSVVLIMPAAFFAAPQRAYAQGVGVPIVGVGLNEIVTTKQTTISAIQSVLSVISEVATQAAEYANYLNTYVLQPLAFILSGNLMKALTASVIGFVIGKANGTGVPQFVTDVRKSAQTVSDGQALAYLKQVGMTKSPFAGSIASALNTDYLTKSSLKGFWDANMCTLDKSSPNVPAYLAGNWSQGGVAAWFALTTQVQNNPYTLYQNTQAQLGNVVGQGVGGATGARLAELNWGQGFMSWCGEADATPAANNPSAVTLGVNPGDACSKDGIAGTIKTPGTVIKATLDKVLGGQQDQIVRMGNIGPQINQILSSITTVMKTVNLASSLLGGETGGLSGLNTTSSVNPTSRLAQFTPTQDATGNFTTGYLGATEAVTTASAANSAVTSANNVSTSTAVAASQAGASGLVTSDMATRVQNYQTAWNVISVAANAASSTVQSLIVTCTAYGNSNQVVSAQTALASTVAPVLTQAAAVPAVVSAALAQIALINSDVPGSAAYTTDLQKLQTMSPTISEGTTAQYNTTTYGSAKASPVGSLTVSGGSLVDQMNLIRTNAEALKISACSAYQLNFGQGGGGA